MRFATQQIGRTMPSQVSFWQLWASVTCFTDTFELTSALVGKMKFFMSPQTALYRFDPDDVSADLFQSPFLTHSLVTPLLVMRTTTMSLGFYSKFERLSVSGPPMRMELQEWILNAFLIGASILLAYRAAISSRLDIYARNYVERIHSRIRQNHSAQVLRRMVVEGSRPRKAGVCLFGAWCNIH